MKEKILILSDSLCQPILSKKNRDISTPYSTIYSTLLAEELSGFDVEVHYREGLDTNDAIREAEKTIALREPNIVIFHIGINDCAPRLFKKNSKSIVLNPFFKKITFDVIGKAMRRFRYLITRFRRVVYTDIGSFEENIRVMIQKIEENNSIEGFFAIGIKEVPSFLEARSYGYNKNIISYNRILFKIFGNNFIDVSDIGIDRITIEDGIHLNKLGHLLYKEKIKQKILDNDRGKNERI